jgi:queuine tRNA-ribosyltransferase
VSSPFRITATDGGARAGVLETAHGPVETPVFMPVGTKASVKAMLPSELRDLGAGIVLANAYHLYFRPGAELIDEMGGVARFSGWDGPVLTDSGGFQVFSLLHTATRIDDEGVRFRSVYDGSRHHFTPEVAMRVQRLLRSDIAMAFDECPPAGVDRARVEAAVRRTGLWAARSRAQPRADGQLGFGIVQGGIDLELRRRSAEEIVGIGFDGYAVGGLSVGEEREPMLETLEATTELLPADRARYLMGVGDPEGLLEGIARGVDMFDCVLPTRLGRTGSALVPGGRINLRNAAHATDQGPLVDGCACPACSRFSRAYIRHLITQSEISGLRLLTIHNLHHLLNLAARARTAIAAGRFADLHAEVAGTADEKHHESMSTAPTASRLPDS